LVAVSASGNSPNVLRAVEVARAREMPVIGMTNSTGGKLGAMADVWLRSTSPDGQVTEEMQLPLAHVLAKCVAKLMFEGEPQSA
jgi:D-sedoheptulose 7-phosphate isomerase